MQTQSAPSFTLADLRDGDRVAYDGQQWRVTDHTTYAHSAWPVAEWTLEQDGETRFLEHDTPHGRNRFRMFRPIEGDDLSADRLSWNGEFASITVSAELPEQITYRGEEFAMAKRDARVEPRASLSCSLHDRKLLGVVGGIAEYLNFSPNLFRIFLLVVCPLLLRGLFSVAFVIRYLIGAPVLYVLAAYLLPDPVPGYYPFSDEKTYRYCVYENGEHVLVITCSSAHGWTAYAGCEVDPSEFDLVSREAAPESRIAALLGTTFSASSEQHVRTIGPPFVDETGSASDRPSTGLSLHDLRAGDLVDYDMRTWTVVRHATVPAEGWPTDMWTLEHDDRLLFLEHDAEGVPPFRMFASADLTSVTVEGTLFLKAVPESGAARNDTDSIYASLLNARHYVFSYLSGVTEAPATVEYEGDEYALAEADERRPLDGRIQPARDTHRLTRSHANRSVMGVFGGVAEYLGIDPSTSLHKNVLVRAAGIGTLMALGLPSLLFDVFILSGPFALITYPISEIVGEIPVLLLFSAVVLYVGLGILLPKAPRPREERLSHYWVYRRDDRFLVLECLGPRDWYAYLGQAVEPHEFDDILPQTSA